MIVRSNGVSGVGDAGFSNYANFQGRSRRSGYWYWALFNALVTFMFNVLAGEVVAGRFGVLQHQLHEVSLEDDGAPSVGTFHGRRSNVKSGWRGLIGWEKDPPDEPFAAKAMADADPAVPER